LKLHHDPDFASVAVYKSIGIAALSGGFAEVLSVFSLGILACVAIYAIYGVCEGSLIRRTRDMAALREKVFAKRP
jgi:hypothetical protein